MPTSYDPEPGTSPLTGKGAYGMVPNLPLYTTDTTKQVGTDKLGQLIASQPDFIKNLGAYTGNIASGLAGEVSQGTANQLSQQAAEFGVGSGMPLSSAAATNFLARYGLTSEALQQQAGKDYMGLMAAWPFQEQQTQTQTTDLGAQRAVYAAAPSPAAAAAAALKNAQAGIAAGRGGVSMPNAGPVAATSPTSGMGWGGYDPSKIAAANAAWQSEDARSRAWQAANAFDFNKFMNMNQPVVQGNMTGYIPGEDTGSYFSPYLDQSPMTPQEWEEVGYFE